MNKFWLLTLAIFGLCVHGLIAQNTNQYVFTLEEVLQRARDQSPAAKRAQTLKDNNYWNYKIFQSNYNPQLRLGGVLPTFSQSFNNISQPDGSIQFLEVRQNFAELELGMEQVITPTGGNISINSATRRFDNFLSPAGVPKTQWSGVPINLRLEQPLFAFNRFKWDKKIQPLRYEESKREFVEEMEGINIRVTSIYFDYLLAQANLDIANNNLNNTKEIFSIEEKRYLMGSTHEEKLLQVELQVLQARQDLAQAQLDVDRAGLALKSFVGLNEASTLVLLTPERMPTVNVDPAKALEMAFQNRAQTIGFDRLSLEAEAEMARALGDRYRIQLNASYGLNNAALQWQNIYLDPNRQTLLNLSFFIPVMDWGRNKARIGKARANRELVHYTIEQELVNFEQEILTKVKNFTMLKERLEITKTADQVAEKRYSLAFKRYQENNISITDLMIAQQEKDRNRRAFMSALKAYYEAYFELRSLTLFDFEENRLLYIPENR